MGHYRLALSNWLRGKRRPREQHEKVETPVDRATSGSREPTWASVDVDAEEEEEDGDVPMLGGRDRRSVSESAVQKSTSMRNMRTFLAVGAPMQVQRGKQQRRSTWASWEQQQSGQQNEHEHKKKKTLGSRLQRRLSRQPSHVPEPASPRCVALTPSIIFIEC